MKNLKYFTPSAFARLHGISKQTLLHYDKIGLFAPSWVDENTGYRYYDSTQLELLDTIFILKEIGVSLKDIKGYLKYRSTEKAIEMLKIKGKELQEKIKDQTCILNRLQSKVEILEQANTLSNSRDVQYVEEEEKALYTYQVNEPRDELAIDIAIKDLLKELTDANVNYSYLIGVIISRENLLSGNFCEAGAVFSLLYRESIDFTKSIKPKGLYGVFYHRGSYRDTGETYKTALEQIERDGYFICSGSFEECIIDNLATGEESEYLTKISIAVKKCLE